jgi:hexosaminidase
VPLTPASASRRASQDLTLCSQDIALSLEDDAPLQGPRAAFLVDIQNPCWIYKDAALEGVASIAAAVGQIPFNFQIGEAVKKIAFAKPETAVGELVVSLGCAGEVIARLPLAPAASSQAVTALPPARIAPRSGVADLCLRFAQPALEPMWVLDSIELAR